MAQKIMVLDGASTILCENFFVKDDIPRILASFVDDGYDIIFIYENEEEDEKEAVLNANIPFWLTQNILFLTRADFEDKDLSYYSQDSVFISNNSNRLEKYKQKIMVQNANDFFESKEYPVINIADIIICYGFSENEFVKFCSQNNFFGVLDKVNVNTRQKKIEGVALFAQSDKSKNDYEFGMDCLRVLKSQNRYTPKHNKRVIGVTCKGAGLDNVNLSYKDNKTLPLLLV